MNIYFGILKISDIVVSGIKEKYIKNMKRWFFVQLKGQVYLVYIKALKKLNCKHLYFWYMKLSVKQLIYDGCGFYNVL